MRIITGLLKGRNLPTPKVADVRPTTDRVKEGIFSVIESRRFIRNCSVLELFAGSGNLGFEALSRGAKSVLFVDHDLHCIEHIEKMAKKFDLVSQVRTARLDVMHFLQGPAVPYDIILADPPYTYENVEQMMELVTGSDWLKEGGWFILEHNKYHDFTQHDLFLLEKEYGRTLVSFFKGAR
ncbi:MAG TPA: 16S rRNA (guanine(966)-N(2))-methyltransferase RsmD [Balneolaceae bacterium]|nr:16S rRNA (guanine(966)-N(2))-methyltransferase RsmD [Balneolaceae bacterium]